MCIRIPLTSRDRCSQSVTRGPRRESRSRRAQHDEPGSSRPLPHEGRVIARRLRGQGLLRRAIERTIAFGRLQHPGQHRHVAHAAEGGDGLREHEGHGAVDDALVGERSEEHTSELQSRGHLVCRLLLEKKKKQQTRKESEKETKTSKEKKTK